MARVVQRSSPPYLTILFVFLFLIAAGLGGWFYSNWRDAESRVAALGASVKNLATKGQLNDQTMSATKTRAKERTVIGQYRYETGLLIEMLVGAADATDMVASEAADRAKALSASQGVVSLATHLQDQVKAAEDRADALQTRLDESAARETKAMEDAGLTQAALSEQLRVNREAITALQTQFDALSAGFQGNIAAANSDWEKQVQALQADLAAASKENTRLTAEIKRLAGIVKGYEDGGKGATGTTAEVAADATILEVLDMGDHTVVYIDIGRDDRVRPGLTFSVYSKRTGVSAEAPTKGVVLVKSVLTGTAECRVIASQTADPMVVGDLVSNLAFDSMDQPVFVVQGRFDLDGSGDADAQGNATVKAMIERFGGKVAEQISVETDYVVMGMQPLRMQRPDADAAATDMALFQQNEQMIQQYQDMINRGVALNRPILNTKQLLTYIGFAPEVLQP